MQKKTHSFIESIVNVLVGYGVAFAAQVLVFPAFGINVSLKTNFHMTNIFTVISIVRSYCIRRAFNKIAVNGKTRVS